MSKLSFNCLKHQKEFIKSDTNTILVGGFGSGKSEAGAYKTIIKKLQNPDYKVAYYLPTYPLIRDIAFDKFTTILDDLKLSYRLNKSDKEIAIENYGNIIFRTMSEPESIIGYEVCYSLIDEADILPKDKMQVAYNKILGRNRAIDDANVDMVSTPEGFKFLYEKANSGHFKVIKAKTTDNKYIPASYIDSLKDQYSPELLKAYLEGEFVNLATGTVYSHFDRDIHTKDIKPDQRDTIHIGQDFNVGGCVSIACIIRDDVAIVVDEFVSNNTFEIVTNIKERYENYNVVIYPDASGSANKTSSSKSDIDILYQAGFTINVPKKNGAVKDRINAVNVKLSKNTLFVNSDCTEIMKSLEQQAYDKNGVPEKFGGAATIDDYNDALGYFIVRKFGIDKPKVGPRKLSFG